MGKGCFFSQTSFLTQACGLTDPVVSLQDGQVIIKGLLPGHLATLLGSDAASVLTQLPANPKPLCLHLDVQITLFKTCLPLSQWPRLKCSGLSALVGISPLTGLGVGVGNG